MSDEQYKYYLDIIWEWLSNIIIETNTIAGVLDKIWIKSDFYKFDENDKKMIFYKKNIWVKKKTRVNKECEKKIEGGLVENQAIIVEE